MGSNISSFSPLTANFSLVLPAIGDLDRMQRRDALEPRRQRERRLYARVQLIPREQRPIARLAAAEQQVSRLDSSAADASISPNHSIARVRSSAGSWTESKLQPLSCMFIHGQMNRPSIVVAR